MRAQVVNCSSSYAKVDCNKYYTPDELTNEALRSENIRQGNSRTEEEDRLLVLEVVSYYRTLYNIFLKAKKYTI
ncbi:hypothetical protein [Lonsdalea populi]|nr:hypothetical protein [Lonsdalea populi]QPQ24271.1 hypothetical protein I6N93_00120 [Lonsdalea populi]